MNDFANLFGVNLGKTPIALTVAIDLWVMMKLCGHLTCTRTNSVDDLMINARNSERRPCMFPSRCVPTNYTAINLRSAFSAEDEAEFFSKFS